MAEAAQQSESMEDILQSIKRIIEDDGSESPAAAGDILDLTQVVQEDGSVATLAAPPKPSVTQAVQGDIVKSIDAILADTSPSTDKLMDKPMDAPPPPPPPPAPPAPAVAAKPRPVMEEGLVSNSAASAAAAALKPIVDSTHRDYSIPHIPSTELRNGNTVEDLLLEALRPMLKAWLDEHLPTIVQKIVEKEVRRIVTFHLDQ